MAPRCHWSRAHSTSISGSLRRRIFCRSAAWTSGSASARTSGRHGCGFPSFVVEALQQSYQREAARVFRYDALVDGERFQARLDTDEFGRVLLYEGLWEAEIASPGP